MRRGTGVRVLPGGPAKAPDSDQPVRAPGQAAVPQSVPQKNDRADPQGVETAGGLCLDDALGRRSVPMVTAALGVLWDGDFCMVVSFGSGVTRDLRECGSGRDGDRAAIIGGAGGD